MSLARTSPGLQGLISGLVHGRTRIEVASSTVGSGPTAEDIVSIAGLVQHDHLWVDVDGVWFLPEVTVENDKIILHIDCEGADESD